MSNRKATFAKRQRESELKDHARTKEARRAERKNQPRTTKGPEIAWDQAVDTSNIVITDVVPAGAPPPGSTGHGAGEPPPPPAEKDKPDD